MHYVQCLLAGPLVYGITMYVNRYSLFAEIAMRYNQTFSHY